MNKIDYYQIISLWGHIKARLCPHWWTKQNVSRGAGQDWERMWMCMKCRAVYWAEQGETPKNGRVPIA